MARYVFLALVLREELQRRSPDPPEDDAYQPYPTIEIHSSAETRSRTVVLLRFSAKPVSPRKQNTRVDENRIDEDTGEAAHDGSGEITWKHENAGKVISGQAWPEPLVWNGEMSRYVSPISEACETDLREFVIGA